LLHPAACWFEDLSFFLNHSSADIPENLRFFRDSLARSSLVLPLNFWPASLDGRGRIETEQ